MPIIKSPIKKVRTQLGLRYEFMIARISFYRLIKLTKRDENIFENFA